MTHLPLGHKFSGLCLVSQIVTSDLIIAMGSPIRAHSLCKIKAIMKDNRPSIVGVAA